MGRPVDLTYSFDSQSIYWLTENGFLLEHEAEGETEKGHFYSANRFTTAEHGGTQIEAPYYFSKEGNILETVPREWLMGPGATIAVSSKRGHNTDFQIQIEDLKSWEKNYCQIQPVFRRFATRSEVLRRD